MPGRNPLLHAGPLTAGDLASMRAALVAGLGQATSEIETPLLGKVVFRTVDELQDRDRVA